MILIFNESCGVVIHEGKYFDPKNKENEYRKWRKRKNFVKNLTTDTKNLMKRPKFDPNTGDYEVLHPWLLNMANTAKDMDRINYLRADNNAGKIMLQKRAETIRMVQRGEAKKNINVKAVQRWIDKGSNPEKIEAHIKWCDTVYRKALNDRAKELRNETKYKNESTIFDSIEMI